MKKSITRALTIGLILACIIGFIGYQKANDRLIDEPEEDIYKAKEYAVSVFNDTMPDDYVIVSARSSIGQDASDNVYAITLTYTIGEDKEEYSYGYKISVDGTEFAILEEIDYSKLGDVPHY